MSALKKCLQCDEDYYAVKAQRLPCEVWGGYEYIELECEWPTHRWADWKDQELTRFRIKPEAFHKYRRTPESQFQWISCEDTVRGHIPSTHPDDRKYFGTQLGDCITCGHTPETETTP